MGFPPSGNVPSCPGCHRQRTRLPPQQTRVALPPAISSPALPVDWGIVAAGPRARVTGGGGMGTERADLLIIGAGLAGSAAAWAATARGRSTVVIEARQPG